MTLDKALNEVIAVIETKDFNRARIILESYEKKYGGNPYFLWQKAIYEQSKGSDKKLIVLPLFEKAYNSGLQDLNFLRQYGMLLLEFTAYAEACKVFGKIIHIKQDDIEAFIILAHIFFQTGNPITSINTLKLAVKINPTHSAMPTVYCGIADALMVCGYQEESVEMYKKAFELDSKNNNIASDYLFHLNYMDMRREDYFQLCQKYRSLWESEVLRTRPPFPQTEKIKIGLISGDFRSHSVSFFIRSIFENYDKNRFEIHLFSTMKREKHDKNTDIFIKLVDGWYDISNTGHLDTADLIKKEGITVLIDLTGHTNSGVSLNIFGLRPAPVQVSYCGYPNTTGLKSMDYRITDRICEPDDAQNFHTENLYKIDECFLCYQPYFDVIPECSFENLQERPIVFGSFNNLSKITTKTIKLWCDVLNVVPNSKLVLKYKYFNDPKLSEITVSRFVENGLSPDRIITLSFNNELKEHYAQYNKIDIAFDTFPYNGTTTTCDALYMGVPVITILGDRHVARVSASLLHTVGLGELVAKDEEEFVKIASGLAGNVQKLAEIKRNLRERMKKSPLMDKISFISKWQNAILDMINDVSDRK